MRVFVLLFNVGSDNEGIYSMRVQDQTGRPRDLIPMFAEEDDAIRFAGLLEAQDFPLPDVEAIDEGEIREFCEESGLICHLIESGDFFLPPEANLEEDDRNWSADRPPEEQSPSRPAPPDEQGDREFSDSELDRIRRQLESLL